MKYKKTSLLAVVLALVLTLGMAAGFTTGAVAKDNDSALPDGQTPVSQRGNEEAGPHANESTPSALLSVNRGDESKFTPEKWAEILKEVEAGEVLFFETAEEERAFWDDEDNAALKESLRSKGSIDMTLVDKLIGVELAGALDGAEGTTLVAVSPEDESKFTPEEWAEILKLVEQGKIRWVEFEADMMLEDGTNGAIVSFVSNDDCPFALVDETNSKNASGDVPYYIANEASVKTVKASDGATYKWLSSEGDAYTDIAPGAEMPIGIVTLGKDQSIVVSLICEDSSDCSVIEVGLKKENSSEKLVIKEASGNFDGLTAERSVEESGEYVLYVKNTGKTSAGFSISYLIR